MKFGVPYFMLRWFERFADWVHNGRPAGAKARLRTAEQMLDSLRIQYQKELKENDRLVEVIGELTKELEERVKAIYARTPDIVTPDQQKKMNMTRLLNLAGLGENNTLWNTVLSYADEHARNERQVGLQPGMGNGQRQYAAGRMASAEDFAGGLRDLRWQAEREAAKIKAQ